jgi:hypothetical protein
LPKVIRHLVGRQTFSGRTVAVAAATVLLCGAAAAPDARAVDGVVELRTTHQEGRAGVEGYSADTLWEVYTVRQGADLAKDLHLNLEFITRRETLEGRSALSYTETERSTVSPLFNLSYQRDRTRLNLYGRALRTDQTGSGTPGQRDESLEGGLWFNSRLGRLNLDGNVRESRAWRTSGLDEREIRDNHLTATARYDLTLQDEFMYRFSRSRQEAPAVGITSIYTSHQLRYRGDHAFADDRGQVNVTLLRNQFHQREQFDPEFGLEYQLPLQGSYTLDDTPEFMDPLEDDPVPVPGLFDNDRSTPTEINIGDNAPPVRDFGGDYRNIMLDFGELTEMGTAILYVNQRLRFPGLMTWSVRFSDDNEGRDWGTLPAGAVTITYQEWENGRQGWVVRIDPSERHRRIKLVNVKLGDTEPDIFVTELEVYRPVTESREDQTSQTLRHQLISMVRYRLNSTFDTWYAANLDRRDFDDDRDLTAAAHQFGGEAKLDGWVLSGTYQIYRLEGEARRNTRSNGQNLSLSRKRTGNLYGQLSWSRTVDDSYDAEYTTNSLTGDVTWRAAPALAFNQKVSRGWREDPLLDETSDSWSLISEIRSYPRQSLQVNLRRADRWVSIEAGTGFTTYNESQLEVNWTILPLLSYSGQAVYQVRDQEDWRLRSNLSWTPLPGGSMSLGFHASDYQDTRTDQLRRGGGATATWRPRPRLQFSAFVDKSYERLRGERNWPLSYQLRGYWTF